VDQPLERSAFAGFSSRLSAGLIDWLIVFAGLWVVIAIPAALEAMGSSVLAAILSLASLLLPVLYFGLLWTRTGQTVGMRTNNIKMVDTRTWEPPSWIRASLRGLVAILTFAGCGLVLLSGFADASASRAVATLVIGLSIAALALIGHLWALRDPRRQSLQDRLFGLAVVKSKPQEEPTLATPVST
jgi:uncharacterized RDD family membrane protein YckC